MMAAKTPTWDGPWPSDIDRAYPGIPSLIWVLCGLATFIVSARLYTRVWLKGTAGWDDILIAIAYLASVGWSIGITLQILHGHMGHHQIYLDLHHRQYTYKTSLAVNIIGPVSIWASRASIIVFLYRMVASITRWRWTLRIVFAINTAGALARILFWGFFCTPADKQWDPQVVGGRCTNPKVKDETQQGISVVNCLIDFMCVIISITTVSTMKQISTLRKIGLCVVLGGGLVTAACSIGVVASLKFSSKDPTYDLVPLSFWLCAEMWGAVIFASLPALRQLYGHWHHNQSLRRTKKAGAARKYLLASDEKPSKITPKMIPSNEAIGERSDTSIPRPSKAICRTTDVYVSYADGTPSAPHSNNGNTGWNAV